MERNPALTAAASMGGVELLSAEMDAGRGEGGALWTPSRHFESRRGMKPRWVIIHGTAGFHEAREVAAFFQQPDTEAATHYVVGRRGELVQCVAEEHAAWGNGRVTGGHDAWWSPSRSPNLETISIEHVKPHADNSDAITEEQAVVSFELVSDICKRHAIPMRPADAHGGITGHYSIDPVRRSYCPGPYPWDGLFAHLRNVIRSAGQRSMD